MHLSRAKVAVLDSFELRPDDWTCAEFDRAIKRVLGKRYENSHAAAYTIADAQKLGRWPLTVERYVRQNCRAQGNVSGVFLPFAHEYGLGAEGCH